MIAANLRCGRSASAFTDPEPIGHILVGHNNRYNSGDPVII